MQQQNAPVKSTHTPGPWVRWEQDDWMESHRELIEYEGNIEIGQQTGFRIATVWRTPREDADANARLIAAAPEEHRALVDWLLVCASGHRGLRSFVDGIEAMRADGSTFDIADLIGRSGAAIAKVRGEAQP